jgi:hypothetical protein
MREIASCVYIGRYETTELGDAGSVPTELSLIHQLIEPALADYPEVSHLGYVGVLPDTSRTSVAKELGSHGLVIADLTYLSNAELQVAAERQISGRPTILLLASNTFVPPIDISQARWIIYEPEIPAKSRNTLSLEIGRLLGGSFGHPKHVPSKELATRVDAVAGALADLRINSLAEHIEQLRFISDQLRKPESEADIQEVSDLTNKVLAILGEIDRVIGSSHLGKLVISGALAALVTGGGLAAATVFTLSIAVWDGPAAFKAAMEKLNSPKP